MPQATLCFLVRGDPPTEVLLGLKKVGFGSGKDNGFGGKVEASETVAEAAVRELREETGVEVAERDLKRVGHCTFRFPARPEWDQMVHVFLVREWEGSPQESQEMRPEWFGVKVIPYEAMWADDAHWLPGVLAGKRVRGWFRFRADGQTLAALQVHEWDGWDGEEA
jgi:8-oxo-dGTP pyrophosphatase MutT (NUDIX family)